MKSRVFMAALVVTLLMGVKTYASDCGPCDAAACDPCGDVTCVKSCDLFSGLKKLVNGIKISDCKPCDGVVACNPCDDAATECNPCDEAGCDDACGSKFALGKRLRGLFASRSCDTGECNPCDQVADNSACGPCDGVDEGCNTPCKLPRLSLKKLFSGLHVAKCDPCDQVADDSACGPCDEVCDDGCGTSCGRGHLIDLPRLNLKKLFDGLAIGKCDTGCGPCDQAADCNPCDEVCK